MSWYESPPNFCTRLQYIETHHFQKERRFDRWQQNETTNLVRAYLVCLDELIVLGEIFSKKLDFFRRLRKDCDNFPELQSSEAGNPPDNENGETPLDRIAFAEHMMEESSAHCKRLGADLRESLNSVKRKTPQQHESIQQTLSDMPLTSCSNFAPSSKTSSLSWLIRNRRPSLSSPPSPLSSFHCRSSLPTLA